MEGFFQFLVYMLAAITVENAIFSRSLGSSRLLIFNHSPALLLLCGGVITAVTTVTTLLCHWVDLLIADYAQNMLAAKVRALVFCLIMTGVYILVYLGNERFNKLYAHAFRGIIPLAALNCVVLGTALLAAKQDFTLVQCLGYSLGTGMGFVLAGFFVIAGKRRMGLSRIPRAFRGLPITWMYIGLISLALYGLAGHGLPT